MQTVAPLSQECLVKIEVMQCSYTAVIYTACKCLGQRAKEVCHDLIHHFWRTSRPHSQFATRTDFRLFLPALNLLILPAFKTSLPVCMNLSASKPEDRKWKVAFLWTSGNLNSLLSSATTLFQKEKIHKYKRLPLF